MTLANLSESEKDVVLKCLRASVKGPFFPDWEFSTLFGLERAEVRDVADAWPVDDSSDTTASIAIGGAMGNLIGYPHGYHDRLKKYISVELRELKIIFRKWKGLR